MHNSLVFVLDMALSRDLGSKNYHGVRETECNALVQGLNILDYHLEEEERDFNERQKHAWVFIKMFSSWRVLAQRILIYSRTVAFVCSSGLSISAKGMHSVSLLERETR